jgi:hypothetical protein
MLINLCTPVANPHHHQPVTHDGGEIIDIDFLPISYPDEFDLQVVCISLEQKLLPPHHACYKESKYDAELRWKYARVGVALFQTHNAARRFIKDHVESLDSQIYILSAEIASQCVSNYGFISKVY